MKKTAIIWVAVAGVAGAGILPLGLIARAGDSDSPASLTNGAQTAQPLVLPAGFASHDLTSESGIRTGLMKITERAVTKGDFNALLGELSRQDRERAREYKDVDQAKLDGVIDRIQTAWKNKYNQDFEVSDKNLIFNDQFAIMQGQVDNPSVAIDYWPVPAMANQAAAAADRNPTLTDEQKQISEAKLTKGRDVAIVRFPAGQGMPEMNVSMIFHYVDFWRVDVPNDRSGEQIYNDLLTHLNYMADHQDQWPSDVNDGYRMVARHAAAALYGVACERGGTL